jgi:hypothetical protein
VDKAAGDALVQRIEHQGWDQGCLVPLTHWVFIANADEPTSELGAQVAAQQDIDAGAFVAHAEPAEQVGAIVTSQVCDLIAVPDVEPFCEAMPLVRVPDDQPLPQPNSTRGFVVDAEQRLVADGTYRLYFEKSLLPDAQATQLLHDERKRPFAAWLGRRSTRAPFPNDFVATVGRAIDWTWRKKRFANSPVPQALYQWRVGIYGDGEDHADFLIPYDERVSDEATVKEFVDDFFGEVRQRLPTQTKKAREYEQAHDDGAEIRDYTIGNVEVRSAKEISMRVMLSMPPLNLEHLTYAAGAVIGAESHLELEG